MIDVATAITITELSIMGAFMIGIVFGFIMAIFCGLLMVSLGKSIKERKENNKK